MDNQYIKGNIVMSNKDIPSLADYRYLHLQQVRRLHITVEVLDDKNRTIETVQGLSTGGSINVAGNSLIRRTGSLSFVLFDSLLPKEESILWMTNKIRIYTGIEDLSSSEGSITHFCQGTFYITEPSIEINKDSRTISISLEDNMMKWEQHELENKLVIESGVPLHTAMEQVVNLHGEFNTNIEFTDLVIPYTLEFNEGETVMSIITKLRDLYMDWECYYDVDGTFVFRKMQIQKEIGDPVAWIFDQEADLITTFKKDFTYKEVKNRVVVIGQIDEKTGLTPRAESSINLESSPFHKDKINQRTRVIADSTLGNELQCESRARYELFKQSTFQEKLTINTIPIYYLDANDIIEVKDPSTNTMERYIIDTIGIGLTIEEEMTINCHKVYYDHFETNSSLETFRQSADIVIDGIQNKGWLSLSESRVSDFLGLSGDGSDLIVRFEYEGKYGVTAYVTGYIGDKTQSLSIDLADFEMSQGESGDNGTGKAEYSDRVLGHEMVHVVMNNAFGVSKTVNFPTWFKEGLAEFIHGADERLKTAVVVNGVFDNTSISNLVNRATDLLNGAVWNSETFDYSAGYLIIKYLDKKISTGKDWKDIMSHIKQSLRSGDLAVKEAIVANTPFTTFQSFVSDFSLNASNFVKYSITLNLTGDEVDTGSIAGIDHRGTIALNAEMIFNNALATRGISATGFNVIFKRP